MNRTFFLPYFSPPDRYRAIRNPWLAQRRRSFRSFPAQKYQMMTFAVTKKAQSLPSKWTGGACTSRR